MRKVNKLLLISCIGVGSMFYSCAEQVAGDLRGTEVEALAIWMNKHRPDVPKINDNLYYKIHKTADSKDIPVEKKDWLDIRFTGQSLDGFFPYEGARFNGNYYENFYAEIARQLGTFSYYCHYVPYRIYNDDLLKYSISIGSAEAVKNLNQGDSAEVFMTSSWAYGSNSYMSTLLGFKGNKQLDRNQPAYMTLKLVDVIKEPIPREQKEIVAYAENVLKLNPKDSISDDIYLKIVKSNPEGIKLLDKDTTVNVWYTVRFTDGFVIDTNIADTALKYNIYRQSDATEHYVSFPVKLDNIEGDATNGNVLGFTKAIRNMSIGEQGTTVFTSKWGYGAIGDSRGYTLIQPYTPLVFNIEVIDEKK